MADAPQGALTAAQGAGLGALVGALDGWRIVGETSAGTTVGGAVALVSIDVLGSALVLGGLAALWGAASRRWLVVGLEFCPLPFRAAALVAAVVTYQSGLGSALQWSSQLGWLSAATISALIWSVLSEHAIFRRWASLVGAIFGFIVLGSAVRQVRMGAPPTLAAGASVVVITVDGLRRDAIRAYRGADLVGGSSNATLSEFETPNLDAFVDSGVVFDDAVSPSPIPLPALAALFTGVHPLRLGSVDSETPVPSEVAYIPELLYRAGWATGAFVSFSNVTSNTGLHRGFQVFDDTMGSMPYGVTRIRIVADLARWSLALFGSRDGWVPRSGNDTLIRFLAWRDRQQGPYFAWVQLAEPMPPFEAHGIPGFEANGVPGRPVINHGKRPPGFRCRWPRRCNFARFTAKRWRMSIDGWGSFCGSWISGPQMHERSLSSPGPVV